MKAIASSFFARRGAATGASLLGAGVAHRFNVEILPHLDGAYNLARYLTRDSALAEDAVQEAMLRAFRAFGQFRGGSARAWLFAIVRNCCRTAQAGSGALSLMINENSLSEEAAAQLANRADERPNPEEALQAKDTAERVREALEAIPEPFREALVLRELEDLSYAEIAQVTGVPVGTVMSRLARGRTILAKELLPSGKLAGDRSRSTK